MSTYSVEPNDRVTYKLHHADEDLLVVGKPPHVPTQPGKGHDTDTLLNALFVTYGQQLQNLGAARDFGLLHRLDLEASGLLIVGLRPKSYDALRAQFKERTIKKFYWAVCAKAPKTPTGVIKLPIGERGGQRDTPKTAFVSSSGKPAVTAYRVLESSEFGALVEARPVTGRLHQLRVHLDAIGSTILGDDFYGPKSLRAAAPRLALHSHRLVFTHPTTGEEMDIRTVWPQDLRKLLLRLKLKRPDQDGAKPDRIVEPDER
jgi:23S rRNA pseudouridine1911/1915/1917 synthase